MTTRKPDDFFKKGYPLKRNEFFHGQMPNANDFNNIINYFQAKIEALSAMLNGPGIVRGLDVNFNKCEWPEVLLDIEPGMAIDRFGRDIVVPNKVTVPIDFDEETRMLCPGEGDVILFYLERDESETQNVPSFGSNSPCEARCCHSRIAESYKITGLVIKTGEFDKIVTKNEEYYSKSEQGASGIYGNADMADVWRIIKHYVNRFQDEVDEPFGELQRIKRLLGGKENDGGVLIWAARYCTLTGGTFNEDKRDGGTVPIGDMARRNILSNDTLGQMIAEHATDFDNPHKTPAPDTKTVTGQYTLELSKIDLGAGGGRLGQGIPDSGVGSGGGRRGGGFISGAGGGEIPGDLIAGAGAVAGEIPAGGIALLMDPGLGLTRKIEIGILKQNGEPISGTVTSVTTGIKISIRASQALINNIGIIYDKYKDEIEYPELLTDYHYRTDWLYGYFIPITYFVVPEIESWRTKFVRHILTIRMIPSIRYTGNYPELTITFIDNIFGTVISLNNYIINEFGDELGNVLLFDCDVTFLWTAHVTENIDMDGVGSIEVGTSDSDVHKAPIGMTTTHGMVVGE